MTQTERKREKERERIWSKNVAEFLCMRVFVSVWCERSCVYKCVCVCVCFRVTTAANFNTACGLHTDNLRNAHILAEIFVQQKKSRERGTKQKLNQ